MDSRPEAMDIDDNNRAEQAKQGEMARTQEDRRHTELLQKRVFEAEAKAARLEQRLIEIKTSPEGFGNLHQLLTTLKKLESQKADLEKRGLTEEVANVERELKNIKDTSGVKESLEAFRNVLLKYGDVNEGLDDEIMFDWYGLSDMPDSPLKKKFD